MTYQDSLPHPHDVNDTLTGYTSEYFGVLVVKGGCAFKGSFRMNRNANENGLRQYFDEDITDTFTFYTQNGYPMTFRKADFSHFISDGNA